MKILRIIARLNVGGPARHVVWLTKELQGKEFQSDLIAGTVPGGEEDMSYLAMENGISPIYIEEMSRELSPKDLISLIKIYREMRRYKPDIIHTHTAKAGTVGRTAAFIYRWLTWRTLIGHPRPLRIVHTFHGHVFHSYYGKAKTKIFLAIEKALARFATDKIVVITKQQFDEINGDFCVGRREQFEVVPLGIDLSIFRDNDGKRDLLRQEINAKADDIIVGYVGRLTEIKNIPLYLNTISKCQNDPTANRLKFVIIGDGHLRNDLERQAAELRIANRLTFLGNRTDAGAFYAGLDIVALTSLNEGTPLSLIEAMAAGRSVISTGVGGVVDLLGNVERNEGGFSVCERGIRVDVHDAETFCKGLIYLANNEQLRNRLEVSGREFAHANYSKERLVADICEMYRKLA
jgi:glycosyltransferase involved in cell wall biosynthesis